MIGRRAIASAFLCLILGACGSGGGGHSAPPDTTPQAFTFATATDVEPNVAVESAAVVVAGIDAPAAISVVGGEYAIDGASFTAAAGMVSTGQEVRVRVTAPSDFATTAAATLTIGGIAGVFSVTTRLPNLVPDAFSFTAATNAALGASVESDAITVSGVEAPTPISVSNGEYAIGSGAFTSAAGTVSNGQHVRLRLTSSAEFATTVEAMLTIGGVAATFDVTTYPRDETPDAFSFTPATDVVRGAIVDSDSIPIIGINTPVTIAVSGGEYSIDGGGFTSTNGTITNGQSVQLRVAASTNPGETVAVMLAVGTGSSDFNVTTSADVTPPTVTVLFPARQTRTGGATVVLRGTASDDSGAVKVLHVNGAAAATSDGYAHWTATVPLAIGDNSLVVDAEDVFLNSNSSAAQVDVRRHPRFVLPYSAAVDAQNGRALVVDAATASLVAVDLTTGARSVFSTRGTPDSNQPFQGAYNVALDTARNRALVYDAWSPAVLAVDLTSGVRSVLSDPNTPNASVPFPGGRDIVLDEARNRLLVLTSSPSIVTVDLDTGARTLLSDAATPDASNPFATPWAMALDSANGRALVTDVTNRAVYAVDLTTGARSILSDDTHPGSANPLSFDSSIVVDAANQRALVMQGDNAAILAVDLATGVRTVLSASGTPDTANPFGYAWALAMDDARGRVLVIDQRLRALLAVDLATGARSYVSRDEPAGTANLLNEPRGIALDGGSGRVLVADHGAAAVFAVDVDTAERTIVSNNALPGPTLYKPRAVVIDDTGERAFVLDDGPLPTQQPAQILTVDLASGGRTMLTDATTPDGTTPLSVPSDLALDSTGARLLVTDPPNRAVIAVDLASGARTIFSGDGVPSTANPLTNPEGIAVDPATARAVVTNSEASSTSSVLAIALDTGSRGVLSAIGIPDNSSPFVDPTVIVADGERHQAFLADRSREQLFRLDLMTGARSVVSGETNRGGVNPLDFPAGIAYDPDRELLYVTDANAAAVVVVDVVTGQRAYLLR